MSSRNSRLRKPLYNGRMPTGFRVYQRALSPMRQGSFVRTKERHDPAGKGVCWENDKYACCVFEPDDSGFSHIAVQRLDNEPARDWRDLQQIKTELVGAEREAVEIFPPESQLVDLANTTWLWVLPEGKVLPFGLHGQGRMTSY